MGAPITTHASREKAVNLRIEGWTFKQIGAELGVSTERARQYVRGTIAEGVTGVEAELKRQALAAQRAERPAVLARQRENRAQEPCRICGDLLRRTASYSKGRCYPCRVYFNHYGVERPAHLHGKPRKARHKTAIRECRTCNRVSRIAAHELCGTCYWRARKRPQPDANP